MGHFSWTASAETTDMPIELIVPSFGESITEVFIESWLKAEGDWVEQDEPVVNIDSDKATLEVPAPAAGILSKLLKKAGDSAQVGEVIARIDEKGKRPTSKPEGPPATEVAIGPAAKRLAATSGIDPTTVEGSGPKGRVLKEDLQQATASPMRTSSAQPLRTCGRASAASRV
jgi:2-oxoglutarate dehydrogenase E2 component (dihydrolipoamide succinyltransferase)